MTSTIFAMTTAEGIVAATFIVAVAAVVLLIVWQLFTLARRGMDQAEQPRRTGHGDHTSAQRGDGR